MRFISPDILFTLAPPDLKSDNSFVQNPLIQGTLVVENDGTIIDVLSHIPEREEVEIFKGAICPGFINAHIHLELSHLKGLIPENTGLVGFIQSIQKIRESSPERIQESIQLAYKELIREGIVGMGDISNSSDSFQAKSEGEILNHTFLECFGFIPSRAQEVFQKAKSLKVLTENLGLPSSISPHAPYSVSPELFALIRNENEPLTSIHNQESEAENIFYQDAQGDFNQLYKGFGMDISFYKPYGKRSLPVFRSWLATGKNLLVHNTYTGLEDLKMANLDREYYCFCPGANLYIEGKLPEISIFQNFNGKILIGTDSLASNHQLSILEELKLIQTHFPEISLNQLLVWACRNGAEFFGWESLGSFEKGKKPGILHIPELGPDFTLNLKSKVHRIL